MPLSIDLWLEKVSRASPTFLDTPQPSSLLTQGEDKENRRAHPIGKNARKRKRCWQEPLMDVDSETTPRPPKRRHPFPDTDVHIASPKAAGVDLIPDVADDATSVASSELESHKSGQLSPTKQLVRLEDDYHVKFRSLGNKNASIPEDVAFIRDALRDISDGIGILGYTDHELQALIDAESPLSGSDRRLFRRPFANNVNERPRSGRMPSIQSIQELVQRAIQAEDELEDEDAWNNEVHRPVLKLALDTSSASESFSLHSVRSARVEPALGLPTLPKRVVDYVFCLESDSSLDRAYKRLKPVTQSSTPSWNHTTTVQIRKRPIAISIETKSPFKSWSDGKPQLASWSDALFRRLEHIVPSPWFKEPPAMPLIVVQGHDWHLLIVSRQIDVTHIWQKVDLGSTRDSFSAMKTVAALHWIIRWARNNWQPWLYDLLKRNSRFADCFVEPTVT